MFGNALFGLGVGDVSNWCFISGHINFSLYNGMLHSENRKLVSSTRNLGEDKAQYDLSLHTRSDIITKPVVRSSDVIGC